jgi:hypothetical protein
MRVMLPASCVVVLAANAAVGILRFRARLRL